MKVTLQGSCLCHSVRYEVEGEAVAIYNCHCQRCRKLSGTGHATNLRVTDAQLRWQQGEELVGSYKVPEAARFRNDFCTRCGSPLPRAIAETGFVILPAGTLDSELPDLPQARIFMGSAAPWSCRDQKLPEHDTYPQ